MKTKLKENVIENPSDTIDKELKNDSTQKNFAIIFSLSIIVILLLALIKVPQNKTIFNKKILNMPIPTPPGHTILSLKISPDSTQDAKTINVFLDTNIDKVTALQIGLDYDPDTVKIVQIKPGTFFNNPIELKNTNNSKLGKYLYALGVQPSGQGVMGNGTVITINYQIINTQKKEALFLLIPNDTLVTASGISRSVIKNAVSINASTTSNQANQYIPLANY